MATQLLNDDRTASIATLMMCSHHAFRRDLACFDRALASFELARADALRDEWAHFRAALHGHHTVEDTGMFPNLRTQQPELAAAIDELEGHHRAIDPLLERGDALFADLARNAGPALEVVRAIADLLATHLDLEERTIVPSLRLANEFPPPPDDAALAMYADGFAWSSGGIAASVLDQVFAMLPVALRERIGPARVAFDERCIRTWGYRHTGSSETSVPA